MCSMAKIMTTYKTTVYYFKRNEIYTACKRQMCRSDFFSMFCVRSTLTHGMLIGTHEEQSATFGALLRIDRQKYKMKHEHTNK